MKWARYLCDESRSGIRRNDTAVTIKVEGWWVVQVEVDARVLEKEKLSPERIGGPYNTGEKEIRNAFHPVREILRLTKHLRLIRYKALSGSPAVLERVTYTHFNTGPVHKALVSVSVHVRFSYNRFSNHGSGLGAIQCLE
ncbi:hypothetical protein BT69DRAFT_1300419 [Atractiella rhizophila]|nr:hypothetical protein BT69DRAFT_1300419 [Atractiella rhizophila]